MLVSLSVRDIVLIDRLDLALESGLNVITGETGAGKSILLNALALAIGGRADRALLRPGAKAGSVTAEFVVPVGHAALAALAEAGLDACEPQASGLGILVRRQIAEDGRSRAFVNDAPVGASVLRAIGDLLIEVHGQHDERGLLDPHGHRRLLDAFAGHDALLAATADAASRVAAARAALAAFDADAETPAHERALIETTLADLDELHPEAGEEAELAAERGRLLAAERVGEDLREAARLLEEDHAPEIALTRALRRIEAAEPLIGEAAGPVRGALERAIIEAREASHEARALADRVRRDPERLEVVESRLFALRAAARRLQTTVDGLADVRTRLAKRLATAEARSGERLRLVGDVDAALQSYGDANAGLGRSRRAAAFRLDAAVAAELEPLKLARARFKTEVSEGPLDAVGAEGRDRVQFLVATNPGEPFGPLVRIASGGEMSRFVLALKVALAASGTSLALVFDEVDQGVGGAVADAIGERLARLARRHQVIVVTHAPQIAARADHHWRIEKAAVASGGEERSVTRVEALDAAMREEEIARMLAGARVSEEARANARRLLAEHIEKQP